MTVSIVFPVIQFDNAALLLNVARTFMTIDQTAVGTSLTSGSIVGISDGDYILLGEFGQDTAEIVRVSGAPSGSTITLTGNTVFVHLRNTPIYRLDRNQVEFSRATTLTGSKSVLATVSILASSVYTVYEDQTNTTGYGFGRAKNSADSTYSNYSESYPYAGYSAQTMKSIFDSCLRDLGLVDSDGTPSFRGAVTRESALCQVNDCQEELALIRHRWSYLTAFNTVIGTIATGQDAYTLPSNIAFEEGNPALMAVRVASKPDLTFIDKLMLNRRRQSAVKTTLLVAITSIADVTITLTSSADMDDSGSIIVIYDDGSDYDTIDYTSNNRTTGVLSGVTGIAVTHAAGAVVWQNRTPSLPNAWAVYNDSLVLDPPPYASVNGRNLYGDIYTKPTVIDDLASEAQFPAAVIKPYVSAKLAMLIDNGSMSRAQGFMQDFEKQKNAMIGKETTGQFIKLQPLRRPNPTTNFRRNASMNTSSLNS